METTALGPREMYATQGGSTGIHTQARRREITNRQRQKYPESSLGGPRRMTGGCRRLGAAGAGAGRPSRLAGKVTLSPELCIQQGDLPGEHERNGPVNKVT